MRVLVFHGYLLRGTGSNVYNAELARAFVRLGHEVHIVCQERHAAELEFVGAVGDWDSGRLVITQVRGVPCTVYRPDIGGLLPVYVADEYEDIQARPFDELTDAELAAYIDDNVEAVREVAALVRPDVALANHLVMGPVILARALAEQAVAYAVKVHGSALEYTVKPHPRFLPYAREGLAGASAILVGSRHTAESLWAELDDPSVVARTRLVPPGVDVAKFRPAQRATAAAAIRELAEQIGRIKDVSRPGDAESVFDRDHAATARALRDVSEHPPDVPLVAFVGKLILSKGIDLLLLAWPLVLAAEPEAQLVVVGFGAYEDGAQRLVSALSNGDLGDLETLVEQGRELEGGPPGSLVFAASFIEWLRGSDRQGRYLAAAGTMRDRVAFTGRLEHDELAVVLPVCEAMVVPSTFPEAFGMVAAEAAASGVLPISAAHSGLAEVSQTLIADVPASVGGLMTFPLGPEAVPAIASRVIAWLQTSAERRETVGLALADTVAAHYSWESVARRVIAAATGRLEQLAAPA